MMRRLHEEHEGCWRRVWQRRAEARLGGGRSTSASPGISVGKMQIMVDAIDMVMAQDNPAKVPPRRSVTPLLWCWGRECALGTLQPRCSPHITPPRRIPRENGQ